MTALTVTSKLSLVGLRLDPDSTEPTFLTLLHGKSLDPILADGQLVFFPTTDLIPKALSLAGIATPSEPTPVELDLVADFSTLLYLLAKQDKDERSVLVNGLNLLFDLVTVCGGTIPEQYRSPLYALTDHMTFSPSIAAFLIGLKVERSLLVDGVLWCLGWVVSHARYLKPSTGR